MNTPDCVIAEFAESFIKDSEELLDEYVESWFADDYCASADNHEQGMEYIPSDI